MLNGFGRKMTCFFSGNDAVVTETIGHWKDNEKRGYMMLIHNNGEEEANLYENNSRRSEERVHEIIDYDPRYNKVAKKIDYYQYIKDRQSNSYNFE